MIRKKYLIIPGWVRSRNDEDKHWIGADKLMELYGVDPAECETLTMREFTHTPEHDLIPLAPRYSGNYTLSKEAQ